MPPARRDRARARQLAAQGDPIGWFDRLYREAAEGGAPVPWDDGAPNPHLVSYVESTSFPPTTALVVGCGLGEDAEWLAGCGFGVTAFDVSAAAVDQARHRFPASAVDYRVADARRVPAGWRGAFGLVVEANTLQVLPPALRRQAALGMAGTVAAGGTLLVVARGREEHDPDGDMPWPLLRADLAVFAEAGLREVSFEDFWDDEDPPVRRFRAAFRR